jgi:hypothetical protein
MKNIFKFLILSFTMLTISQISQAQGRYEVRVTHSKFNCTADSVEVCVEIRATSTDSAFVMGSGNVFLIYENAQLASPVFRRRGLFTSANNANYALLGMTITPGTTTSALSLNIVNNGVSGEGITVSTAWSLVACLAFKSTDPNNQCYNLTVSPSSPSTVMTLAYKDPNDTDPNNPMMSLTKTISRGALTSISNQCPTTPVVALTGGGVINSGDNANLTIAVTNNTLPATVTLTGGINVQLDAQNPSKVIQVSPSVTTEYEIQSVSGSCGTGTAAAGQNKVTVTINSSGCPPQKCIPATVTLIK